MGRAPLLSTPGPLYCLSVSVTAVSSVLIRPRDSSEHPVYYVSKALQDTEVRYPDIEKLAFTLKPETSGRLVKWAIELGEFDIHYKPRPATKGQVVADFISEFTKPHASAATQLITEPILPSSQDHAAIKGTLDLT
ncbi:hypothetical protein L3X38_036680 [Prunus dulcis]|uniref:Reverse transcriptase RNase H-like domain-containing protein n=1 Tax=Prunus dulcis TaxID=3755 RepID=A0AAD4YQK8_PRUDU|nr:hypothetical protein L3X38_036680 [Prunus dulcis]